MPLCRRVARRLAAITELVATEGHHSSDDDGTSWGQLLEEHTTGILASLTVALDAPADAAPLHSAASHVQLLRTQLGNSQQVVGGARGRQV